MRRRQTLLAVMLLAAGCGGSPDKANIELRKQNQDLRGRIATLERQVGAQQAQIRAFTDRQGATTAPTLPQERLDRLFTTTGIRLGKLTAGMDLDIDKPGDEGIKLYVVPIDNTGETFKAAGRFEIEAFDLAQPNDALLGRWTFEPAEAAKHWSSFLTQFHYALPLPWQDKRPAQSSVTVKVTFVDELTGRTFTEQRVVNVALPGVSGQSAVGGRQ